MNPASVIVPVFTVVVASPAIAQPRFDIHQVGLADAEHTEPTTGERSSSMWSLANPGWVAGTSRQLAVSPEGATVWFADPVTWESVPISPRDAEHTSSSGQRNASIVYTMFAPNRASILMTARRWVGENPAGTSSWRFSPEARELQRLGFWDTIHTNTVSGEQVATILLRGDSDDVAGTSSRYISGITRGTSAWHSSPGGPVVRIGLWDALHVAPDGACQSTPTLMNTTGIVAGTSVLYHGAALPPGQSAWRFDPAGGGTIRLGLLDAEHTDPTGYHVSTPRQIDTLGNVCGESDRYVGGQYKGLDVWVYRAATGDTATVAIMDAEHASASGLRTSRVAMQRGDGFVFGRSTRYNGGWIPLGDTPWVFNVQTEHLTRAGLTDAAHTSSTGVRSSGMTHRLADGRLIGWSRRYRLTSTNGTTVWMLNPSTGQHAPLGYFDAAHVVAATGYHESQVGTVTPSGIVCGVSRRGTNGPMTVWRFDPLTGVTTQTGVLDAAHLESTGYASGGWGTSGDARVGEDRVVGFSDRLAAVGGGRSHWYFDSLSGTVHRLGLTDSRHLLPTGASTGEYRDVFYGDWTVGSADRYLGTTEIGETAFLHDAATRESHPIVLSERGDGYAYSSVSLATPAGRAFGVYRDFSAPSGVEYRGFYRDSNGVWPLDLLVDGGFESAGYRHPQYEDAGFSMWSLSSTTVAGTVVRADRPGYQGIVLTLLDDCDADVNCDFALDGFDVEIQELAIGGDMTDYCPPDPDFNRDFALDGFDIEDVETVVGGGPCP